MHSHDRLINTYGISSGKTSAMILMLSVFAFDVGAAANKIFKRAIMYCGRLGRIAWYNISTGLMGMSPSIFNKG